MKNIVISDEAIDSAFVNTNFGNYPRRDLIANALLKYSCGYSTGWTIQQICMELKLINSKKTLTKSGKQFLFESYKGTLSV